MLSIVPGRSEPKTHNNSQLLQWQNYMNGSDLEILPMQYRKLQSNEF